MLQINKLIKNIIIWFPLIFLFFPAFYIGSIPIYDITIAISIMILSFYINPLNIIFSNFKYKFFKILIYYIFWVTVTGLILVLKGKFAFNYYLYAVFVQFFINNLMWYIYPSLAFPKIYSLEKLIKFLLVFIYIVCLYGLLEYICIKLGINLIENIKNVIINRRAMHGYGFYTDRIQSFFDEPGYLGSFLCINLPIIYKVILSKFKILKSKLINYWFKKTYIPLIWLIIFLTMSPIWIVFSIILTIIYFSKKIFSKKTLLFFLIILPFFVISSSIVLKKIDLEKTYVNRIFIFINYCRDFNTFNRKEPSLGIRIFNYRVRYNIFKDNIIFGVGYKNTEYHALKYYEKSNWSILPTQTPDIGKDNYTTVSGSILWNALSDTGIVGIILLYAFLLNTIIKYNDISKVMHISLEQLFMQGVKGAIIAIVCISFYDLRSNFVYFWFLYGLLISYIQYYKKLYYKSNKGE